TKSVAGPTAARNSQAEVTPQPVTLTPTEKHRLDNQRKEECARKIQAGEYEVIELEKTSKSSSEAWGKFGRVVDGEEPTDFVQCLGVCGEIKICKVKTGSRHSLSTHVCPPPKMPKVKPLPRDIKSTIASHCADLSAETFTPFVLAEAETFTKLAQCLIQIGHEYGPIDAKNILPSGKTVANKLHENADMARAALMKELEPALQEGMVSGTMDGWTDNQKHRKYYAHTVQHIDKTWTLSDNLTGIPHCDAESVTAEVINEEITLEKTKLNFPPTAKIHYVTDDGADVVAAVALSGNDRSYCMDHCTNLVTKKAMTLQLTKTDLYGNSGGKILNSVQSAVNCVMSSRKPIHSALKRKLKKGPTVTVGQKIFKSHMPMLKSARDNFEKLVNALNRENQSGLLENVRKQDIVDVINIVGAIEALACKAKDKRFVADHAEQVKKILEEKEGDSNLATTLKTNIAAELALLPLLVLIKKLKGIVTYMKSTGLNDKLPGGTLRPEVDTRWMSLLTMVKSFFPSKSFSTNGSDSFTDPPQPNPDQPGPASAADQLPIDAKINKINSYLLERGKEKSVGLITLDDVANMLSLVPVLEAFETAIKKFEAEYTPTIHQVVPQYYCLLGAVQVKEGDTDLTKILKGKLEVQLNLKYKNKISMRQKVAYLLWPRYKHMPAFSDDEKTEVYQAVNEMVAECRAVAERCQQQATSSGNRSQNAVDGSSPDDPPPVDGEPSRKRRKTAVPQPAPHGHLEPDGDGAASETSDSDEENIFMHGFSTEEEDEQSEHMTTRKFISLPALLFSWGSLTPVRTPAGGGQYYAGSSYQQGHGIGSWLGGLFRTVFSLLKSGATAVGREAARAGAHVLADVASGDTFADSAKRHTGEAVQNLKRKVASAMSGTGRAIKRPKPAPKRHTVTKARSVRNYPSDIYS
ncbi:Transposable element Hobo transposase, partial [Frankliniella fusca]